MYYLEFETLKEILSLNDEVLQSVLKKIYSIDAGSYDLVETAVKINNLLGKDVLELYSLHLIVNFTLIKDVIAKLGENPSYLEELEEMDKETFKNMQVGISNLGNHQANHFRNNLLLKIRKGSGGKHIDKGYEDYVNYLEGFNVIAFNAVIDALSKEDEEEISDFQAQFDYIPKYLVEKYRLEQLKQSISKKEAQKKELEVNIKNLKESTEASLGKIIELFNHLNMYAFRYRISTPYPFKYNKILVNNEDHRKGVQKVLMNHTPIYVNNI